MQSKVPTVRSLSVTQSQPSSSLPTFLLLPNKPASNPKKISQNTMSRETLSLPAPPPTTLAPWFRFHPTDEELVMYYLKHKVCGEPFRNNAISEVDIYKSEPWDLAGYILDLSLCCVFVFVSFKVMSLCFYKTSGFIFKITLIFNQFC